MPPAEEVTRLLIEIRSGDSAARERLYDLVYEDLRRIARSHLRGRPTGTLGTTAMVHEGYLRLAGAEGASWNDRVHFLSVARVPCGRSSSTRRADASRRSVAAGSGPSRSTRTGWAPRTASSRCSRSIKPSTDCKGWTTGSRASSSSASSAASLGLTDRTVKRDWRKARTLLHTWLRDEEGPSGSA